MQDDSEDDHVDAAEEARLRQWAHDKCKAWNWNADVAEIAKELIDADIDTDSHQFTVLCDVFNEFFKHPKMDVTEAIEQIMETFS